MPDAEPTPTRASSHAFSRVLERAFGGAGFPTFIVCTLVFESLLSTAMLLVPFAGTPLEAFAQEFKVWCFGYDPSVGTYIWAMVASFTSAPLLLAAFVTLVFWAPLREAKQQGWLRLWPAAALSATLVMALAVGLVWSNPTDPNAELPFPADSLRTTFQAPEFTLVDHKGATLTSAQLRGRVTMVTAVYSTCGTTCPMILGEAKRAVEALTEPERRGLRVVGITLDPAHDTAGQLADMMRTRGLDPSVFHLATGEPANIEATLDRFSIARGRNAETGVIEHQNVFILIDHHARIAYRLSPGSRQTKWLETALRLLLREAAEVSLAQTSSTRL